MTTEAINDFVKAAQADEEMAQGLVAAIGQRQRRDAAEAFAAYAQGQGFAVTRQDAEALQKAASNAEGSLSEEELEGVAGGSLLGILGIAPGLAFGVALSGGVTALSAVTVGRTLFK